jgi:hypothetical protein
MAGGCAVVAFLLLAPALAELSPDPLGEMVSSQSSPIQKKKKITEKLAIPPTAVEGPRLLVCLLVCSVSARGAALTLSASWESSSELKITISLL